MKKTIMILTVYAVAWFMLCGSGTTAVAGCTQQKTPGGIVYLSGGVGQMERAAMLDQFDEYNLKLAFALRSGHFIADVMVTIQNENGAALIQEYCEAPWFLVKLPPGTYTVTARFNNEDKQMVISLGHRFKTATFHWKI